jgi:epoxyqueuosine reductase
MQAHSWLVPFKSYLTHACEALGFAGMGVSLGPTIEDREALLKWLNQGLHGEMSFMHRWGSQRAQIDTLLPEATRVISVRHRYYPKKATDPHTVLADPNLAYISRYALNRDYHKIMRPRLALLAQQLNTWIDQHLESSYPKGLFRATVDSAPLMEKPAAREAGLGFIGKNTNLIDPKEGSWFFLGELITNVPIEPDRPATAHCGTCSACIGACPTQALSADGHIDARRCISYLTIEYDGVIDKTLRPLMGNRIYGCDDCQLVCPFNSFMIKTNDADFSPRLNLDRIDLLSLFGWSESQFLKNLEGSPIRRIGHERFMRNIAIALGNAPYSPMIVEALKDKLQFAQPILREHIEWAIEQQLSRTT